MEKLTLKVKPRKIMGRKVRLLRKQGFVPANIYGKKISSQSVEVGTSEFEKLYAKAGGSTLVYLRVEGESADRPTLVRNVSAHPVSNQILHIDFNQVDLKEKIKAPVSIKLLGEPEAVKNGLGILVQQMNELEIDALPADMPEHIEADVSFLSEVDQAVYVKDLKLGSNLKTEEDPEMIVAKIEKLAAEEKEETPAVATEDQPAGPAVENSDQSPEPSEDKA